MSQSQNIVKEIEKRELYYTLKINKKIVHTNIGAILNFGVQTQKTIINYIKSNPTLKYFYQDTIQHLKRLLYDTCKNLPKELTDLIAEYSDHCFCQALTYSKCKKYTKHTFGIDDCYQYNPNAIEISTNLIIVSRLSFHQWKNELQKYSKIKYIIHKTDFKKMMSEIEDIANDFDIILINSNVLRDLTISDYNYKKYVWNRVWYENSCVQNDCTIQAHFIWLIMQKPLTLMTCYNHARIIHQLQELLNMDESHLLSYFIIKSSKLFHYQKYYNKISPNIFYQFFQHIYKNSTKCFIESLMTHYVDRNLLYYCAKPNYIEQNIIIKFLSMKTEQYFNDIGMINHNSIIAHFQKNNKTWQFLKLLCKIQKWIITNKFCIQCCQFQKLQNFDLTNNFICTKCVIEMQHNITFNFNTMYAICSEIFSNSIKSHPDIISNWFTKALKINDNDDDNHDTVYSTEYEKLIYVHEIIQNNPKKSFIIFTNNHYFVRHCNLNFNWQTIKGNANRVNKLITQFNENIIKVLFITPDYLHPTLNLYNTDELIIVHDQIPHYKFQILLCCIIADKKPNPIPVHFIE